MTIIFVKYYNYTIRSFEKGDDSVFGAGDTVIYGSQGVCKITRKEQKRIGGKYVDYLVLQPVYDENSTIFVPANNEVLTGKMKPVLSQEEIYDMINSISDDDIIMADNDSERREQYQKIIAEGDRRMLFRLIKTLYLEKLSQEKKGKKLHQSDGLILKQAEKLLHNEFALVLDMKPDEVLPFIINRIEKKIS